MSCWEGRGIPSSLAINLELSHGPHGASARVELRGAASEWADVSIRGWIDPVALRRLREVLHDLATRGVRSLALDCSQLRHIEFRLIPALLESLGAFDGGDRVRGLSHRLGDVFRLAGWNPDPTGVELPIVPLWARSKRECAS